MNSDVLRDYLLNDERQLAVDLFLELGRESTPDRGGVDRHNTS